jgi:hypothetical protein
MLSVCALFNQQAGKLAILSHNILVQATAIKHMPPLLYNSYATCQMPTVYAFILKIYGGKSKIKGNFIKC